MGSVEIKFRVTALSDTEAQDVAEALLEEPAGGGSLTERASLKRARDRRFDRDHPLTLAWGGRESPAYPSLAKPGKPSASPPPWMRRGAGAGGEEVQKADQAAAALIQEEEDEKVRAEKKKAARRRKRRKKPLVPPEPQALSLPPREGRLDPGGSRLTGRGSHEGALGGRH